MPKEWIRRRSNMSGHAWGQIMAAALDRHGDAPSVDDVCDIALELYPGEWAGSVRSLLPVVAASELRETMKQVAYLREAARERGLPATASVASIQAAFLSWPRPFSMGSPHVDVRASRPPLRAEAAL